jgi:hypothetical protein
MDKRIMKYYLFLAKLGPQIGTPNWDSKLGPEMGHRIGTLNWKPQIGVTPVIHWDPELGL